MFCTFFNTCVVVLVYHMFFNMSIFESSIATGFQTLSGRLVFVAMPVEVQPTFESAEFSRLFANEKNGQGFLGL